MEDPKIENQVASGDIMPQESPDTELASVMNEGDPDALLAIWERKAALAPRFKEARDAILASQTYAEDWQEFGKDDKAKMCLASAGAERVGTLFDIKFFEVADRKETFTDSNGPGYRYVCEGKATMGNRIVVAKGIFSTRDKFLGFANENWKTLEEINERSIQMAAYHIFCGNSIKALLGLRGIPVGEWKKIMERVNRNPDKAGKTTHGAGTSGGTVAKDSDLQRELVEMCIEIANAGQWIKKDDPKGDWGLVPMNDLQSANDPMAMAKMICLEISSFAGKGGNMVAGLTAKKLKGTRLQIAHENAKKLVTQIRKDK